MPLTPLIPLGQGLCSDPLMLLHGFPPGLSNSGYSALPPMFQGLLPPTSPILGDSCSVPIGGVVLRGVFSPGMPCVSRRPFPTVWFLVPVGFPALSCFGKGIGGWSSILSYSGHPQLSSSSSVSRGGQKLRVKLSILLLLFSIRFSLFRFLLRSLVKSQVGTQVIISN